MVLIGAASVQCQNTPPFALSVASATVSSSLLLITVPTNLLVCLAILIDPKKELRTQFNCFTFNLALADLLVGCVTEPISAYAHIGEALNTKHKHTAKPVDLKLFHVPYFISEMASLLTVAALALERYLALTAPFWYRRHFSVKLSVALSVAIWIVSFGFGLLNIVADYIRLSFIFVNTAVLFAGIVVCFACYKIRASLREVSRNWAKLGIQSTREETLEDTQMKLTKTFALIIGALLCCYAPACFMIYYMNWCQECDCRVVHWFRDVTFWLVLLNSAVNPFVYAIRSASFRKAIAMIIRCRCGRGAARVQLGTLMRYRKEDAGKAREAWRHGRTRGGIEYKAESAHHKPGPTSYGSINTESGEEDGSTGQEHVQLI